MEPKNKQGDLCMCRLFFGCVKSYAVRLECLLSSAFVLS